MAAGFRSALPHLGISAEGASVQGGLRTPLPWWNAGGSTGAEQGGFRTPLPGWNAGGTVGVEQGGYLSLLGFWIGGASAGEAVEPPEPEPEPEVGGGGGRSVGAGRRRRKLKWRQDNRYHRGAGYSFFGGPYRWEYDGSREQQEALVRKALRRRGMESIYTDRLLDVALQVDGLDVGLAQALEEDEEIILIVVAAIQAGVI